MQIVRDLGGYSLGRSDLVRRAMSKKKQSVMEKERANFIYGNKEEGVPGCLANGISEAVAGKIYDDMMDFAKYAFNKSHAACYAVVSYQTAFLKYYYPVQFMAALMTSVIDNPRKVAEYIMCCRNMGIEILPPNINESNGEFSVSGNAVRYALLAIKSVGRPVIEFICQERKANGPYTSLNDFLTRIQDGECNKRAVEHFIKAGVLDCLGGTRKQFMEVYIPIMDKLSSNKKNNIAGQMSLLDLLGEGEKEEFEISLPNVGEYTKEEILTMEKEVLGIYVSGHPLENYKDIWEKYITATSADFMLDEETGHTNVEDTATKIIGGLLTEKTIKYTKNDKTMAFLEIEDLYGTVEVVVFPKDYERYHTLFVEDTKVFVKGRVSLEEDKNGKLICEKVTSFEDAEKLYETTARNTSYQKEPKVQHTSQKLWIRFDTMQQLLTQEQELTKLLLSHKGTDKVVLFVAETKQKKELPKEYDVCADAALLDTLYEKFGKNNVKLV